MGDLEEMYEELIRLRQEVEYWKDQCTHVEENERALKERKKELEAQLCERQDELKELQAFEAELKRYEQLLESLSKEQVHETDSSDSEERGDATEEELGAFKD